jgi:threonyl-tRNA synthetase
MSSRLTPRERLQADGTLDPHVVAVRANGKIVDLHTPIDATIPLTPIRDTDKDAVAVIRHSTAHVMADAVQRLFPGTHVTIGPAIEDGFYYDFEKQTGRGLYRRRSAQDRRGDGRHRPQELPVPPRGHRS